MRTRLGVADLGTDLVLEASDDGILPKDYIAGITTNACVMITAGDVHIRDLGLFVPSDCVAALTEEDQHKALEFMEKNFRADTTPAEHLDLNALSREQQT
jgi:isochorismate hydrolase